MGTAGLNQPLPSLLVFCLSQPSAVVLVLLSVWPHWHGETLCQFGLVQLKAWQETGDEGLHKLVTRRNVSETPALISFHVSVPSLAQLEGLGQPLQ